MENRFHGVFSLALILVAVAVGIMALIEESRLLGVGYAVLSIFATATILYAYCAKCTIRSSACRHVFPGKWTIYLPERTQAPYTLGDYFWTGLSLAAIAGFPQFWLWRNKVYFILFWLLFLFAVLEIFLAVCRGCGNEGCILAKQLKSHR